MGLSLRVLLPISEESEPADTVYSCCALESAVGAYAPTALPIYNDEASPSKARRHAVAGE